MSAPLNPLLGRPPRRRSPMWPQLDQLALAHGWIVQVGWRRYGA